MKPELVSFKLCPFVQRSIIVMQEKGVEYDLTYINLKDPPDWFKSISPLGKVPLLKMGETVLFESAVIMEYLDETHPPSLHPADPLQKAQQRAWMEFASTLLMNQYALVNAADESTFEKLRGELVQKLTILEAQIAAPYFSGDSFQLVDAAFAPFWMRLNLLESWQPLNLLAPFPKLSRWSAALLQRPAVQQSVVADFADLYRGFIGHNGTLGGSRYRSP